MGNDKFNTGGTLQRTKTPSRGSRNDGPLCSYADLTFYPFISSPREIRHAEEQTSLSQWKREGERVNPRIDLIPYCKLFLDIVSRPPFPMCS